ncbi:sugar phosphate isomerase/epimerase family protein [Sphingobacterium sp. Mn56C]|uniref:sugar phosphate isomerase/epimerase family protein n=1 Tax=Sphingobacterium sp. Mn56C TaxID=3395261 RepID=UPI003BE3CAD6
MNRKQFLLSSGLLLTVGFSSSMIRFNPRKMDRIGLGTVIFRDRFIQTKPKTITPVNGPLTLLEIPTYYKDRFGINQIEFWSEHFESLQPNYLNQLKAQIKKQGSTLINVQVDVDYDLASTDETRRKSSLSLVKNWVDAAAFLGSRAVRVNPGRANGHIDQSIKSMQEISAYARSKKLILLSENHFGIEMDPDKHIEILKKSGPNHYTLPDFGNYPVEGMYESLAKIIPYAYMISAKIKDVDSTFQSLSYDYKRCIELAESLGFKGIYCLEQWSPNEQLIDFEKLTDTLIADSLQAIYPSSPHRR